MTKKNEYTVISIGDYAFAGQIGMNSITIPETVEKLGSGVFEECTGLTKIICESATPPSAISETVKPQVIVLRAARQSGVDARSTIGVSKMWNFMSRRVVLMPTRAQSLGENSRKSLKVFLPVFP